ncbi:MAG: alpha/beta hydrolase [Treponema sp.]|nr:alpha/beta hydrolase [Treponema sp.]
MKKISLFIVIALFAALAFAAKPSSEYPMLKITPVRQKIWDGVPSMKGKSSRLDYYKPIDKSSDAAVIVCPGGSYHHLGMYHEGKDVALWLCSKGISAFVLKYRVSGNGWSHPAMLQDIQRAIQIVRQNAAQYGINPNKIGAIGFSAGGHLVLMAAEFSGQDELKKLGIDAGVSLAPNFIVPVYPVVSMQDDIAHVRSRKSLLRNDLSQERKDMLSLELHADKIKCPVFLIANKDDRTVDYRNSERMDLAMSRAGVQHVFVLGEKGDHGFGMGNNDFVHTTKWNDNLLLPWLRENGFAR